MDSTWQWRPFLQALETDEGLRSELLRVMDAHDLYWLLQTEAGEGQNFAFVEEIKVGPASPLLWHETEAIDWPAFTDRLRAVPDDRWLNVHLCAWTEKASAIEAGEGFAEQVSAVFGAILPLYLASAGAG